MKSKKKNKKKKKFSQKDKFKIMNKIKYYFTKKLKKIYKKSDIYLKKNNFKNSKKKIKQFGGESSSHIGTSSIPKSKFEITPLPTTGTGVSEQTKKFLQYSGTGSVAPGDTSAAKWSGDDTLALTGGMLAVDIPLLITQMGVKPALSQALPCFSTVPGAMDMGKSMACTLFEGVSVGMVQNGINGEATGSSPQQNLSLNSYAS